MLVDEGVIFRDGGIYFFDEIGLWLVIGAYLS